LALSILVAAARLALTALISIMMVAYAGLCLAAIGIASTFGVFWALPGDHLRGTAGVDGLALINSVGLLGRFVGLYVVGFVCDRLPGFTTTLLVLSASTVVHDRRRRV
jgi:MFS transporter, ACS family, tartrate transporter